MKMKGRSKIRSTKRPIRVVLVPSQTYEVSSYQCNLRLLRDRLNESQDCFLFLTLKDQGVPRQPGSPFGSYRSGAKIERITPLANVKPKQIGAKTLDERQVAVDTYIEYKDVFRQLLEFTSSRDLEDPETTFRARVRQFFDSFRRVLSKRPDRFRDDDLIVGIGSEVAMPDLDAEAEGTAELDAYACLSYWGDDSEGMDNNIYEPLNQVCFISLRRLALVFPEATSTDQPERARALVSRYVIMNVAGYLAARTVASSPGHFEATGCLNEEAWIGAEREGYYVRGFCDACLDKYESLPVAVIYKRWSTAELVKAIEKMADVPRQFDESLKNFARRTDYRRFAALTVATGLFSNLLLDVTLRPWDVQKDFSHFHVNTHYLAIATAITAIAISYGIGYATARSRSRLP